MRKAAKLGTLFSSLTAGVAQYPHSSAPVKVILEGEGVDRDHLRLLLGYASERLVKGSSSITTAQLVYTHIVSLFIYLFTCIVRNPHPWLHQLRMKGLPKHLDT